MRAALVLAALLALPAAAADHDAAYYQRTGTQPPGSFLIGPKLAYMDDLGVGLNFGYEWHDGPTLLFDITAMRIDGVQGETPFSVGYCDFKVPYTVHSRTTAAVGVSLLFKPKPKKR